MANNLVVQLLLKTGTFSTDLKTAKGQVQQFQKGCQTAGKSLDAFGKAIGIDIGALTKFGGAVGIAVAAGKGLKAVIDSNQKSADTFAGVMYAAKTAVGELAYAIGTFDFSNFQNGLSDLIRRARDAYGAIDQLGNTLMSYNIAQAKANAAIAAARAGQKNPDLSPEQKQALVDAANAALEEAREATGMALQDFETAIIAEVNAKGAKLSGEGAMELVDKFLTLDGKKVRDDVKASMSVLQTEYDKGLNDLYQKYGPGNNNGFSNNFGSFSYSDSTWKNNEQYKRDLDELNEKYKELHVYNTLLVKEQDKELEKLGQQRINMYGLETSLSNMERTLDVVEGKVNNNTTATENQKNATKGSLEHWKQMAAKAEEIRNKQVFGSAEWLKWDLELKVAREELEKINEEMDKLLMKQSKEKYKDYATPITGKPLQGQVINTKTEGLAGTGGFKMTIPQIDASISSYEDKRGKTTDPKLLAHYNQMIKKRTEEKNKMESLGLDEMKVSSDTMDSWEEFGSVLSSVSSVASNLSTVLSSVLDDETMKKFDQFFKWVNVGVAAFQALTSIIEVATGVQKLFASISQKSSAETATAATTEAAAVVAAKQAETAAATGSAGAKGADAVAGIPIVGPALAIAAVASVIAAIMALVPKVPKFANGGIVGGSSFYGDRVTANVNSGEMILNRAQQANLFNMINSGSTGRGNVEFHISGTDLVGVLNNQNRKNNLIR